VGVRVCRPVLVSYQGSVVTRDRECCRCEGWGYTFAPDTRWGSAEDGQRCARCAGSGWEPVGRRPLYSAKRVRERLAALRARYGAGARAALIAAAHRGWGDFDR